MATSSEQAEGHFRKGTLELGRQQKGQGITHLGKKRKSGDQDFSAKIREN